MNQATLNNAELRLPPVAKPHSKRGNAQSWSIKGKKARVVWSADKQRAVLVFKWSDKLFLIHKYRLSSDQVPQVVTQMREATRINLKHWTKLCPHRDNAAEKYTKALRATVAVPNK
jgi:hypothetical protein